MKRANYNIVGIDEVGRGSLFGPVFAGAIVLNQAAETLLLKSGLKDSKKLTFKKRALLSPLIKKHSSAWAIGEATNKEIDEFGIRDATEIAMIRALDQIQIPIDLLLVDGILPIKNWNGKQKTLIKGDDICPSISAASVIAKDSRDCLITKISEEFPGYGLQKNFGYGTKEHRNALNALGITRLHRKSFLSKIISI